MVHRESQGDDIAADGAAGPPHESWESSDGEPAATPDPDPGGAAKTASGGGFWRELGILVAIALVLALLIRAFVVQSFYIPSSSMERTLHGCPGCTPDRVLVNRFIYHFHDPKPGDVVVFSAPAGWEAGSDATSNGNVITRAIDGMGRHLGFGGSDRPTLVKRVIAVGGQTVQCCDAKGRVEINGVSQSEPYVYRDGPDPKRSFGPERVPKGDLWVMGDHRNVSADSRWHTDAPDHGFVPIKDVIGEAFSIYWPPSRWSIISGKAEPVH